MTEASLIERLQAMLDGDGPLLFKAEREIVREAIAALSRATEPVAVAWRWKQKGRTDRDAWVYDYARPAWPDGSNFIVEPLYAAPPAPQPALSEQGEATHPAADWRTMDSAPKDRREILVAWKHRWDSSGYTIFIGRWKDRYGWVDQESNPFSSDPDLWSPIVLPSSPGIASQAEEGSGE